MPELTAGQYETVLNVLSLAIASMGASFVFFAFSREEVSAKYRGAVIASSLVVLIAGYHYFRIFNNWEASYAMGAAGTASAGHYVPTGVPFNHAYRYVDWVLTVPLLMVELVLVLGLPAGKTASLMSKLVIAAFLMIILGYPGELDKTSTSMFSPRGTWGFLSTIPFVYILFVLVGELRAAMERSSRMVGILLRNAALLTVFTWGFYPVAFMAPFFGLTGGSGGAETYIQVGYSLADILAKCGYGILIFNIAKLRTGEDAAPPLNRVGGPAPVMAGV